MCVCVDGLPSSALSSSGPGSAPPPSSTLDNFAPPPPSSFLPQQQPPSASHGAKLAYPNCGPPPPTSSQGPPQPVAGAPRPVMDGGAAMAAAGGFMPQQSQVFVFSTSMANQAAEAVERGLCRTIIDFHIEQPRTRQFLQVSLIPDSSACVLAFSFYVIFAVMTARNLFGAFSSTRFLHFPFPLFYLPFPSLSTVSKSPLKSIKGFRGVLLSSSPVGKKVICSP